MEIGNVAFEYKMGKRVVSRLKGNVEDLEVKTFIMQSTLDTDQV